MRITESMLNKCMAQAVKYKITGLADACLFHEKYRNRFFHDFFSNTILVKRIEFSKEEMKPFLNIYPIKEHPFYSKKIIFCSYIFFHANFVE